MKEPMQWYKRFVSFVFSLFSNQTTVLQQEITEDHIRRVLKTTRPSVSSEERRRLDRMWAIYILYLFHLINSISQDIASLCLIAAMCRLLLKTIMELGIDLHWCRLAYLFRWFVLPRKEVASIPSVHPECRCGVLLKPCVLSYVS